MERKTKEKNTFNFFSINALIFNTAVVNAVNCPLLNLFSQVYSSKRRVYAEKMSLPGPSLKKVSSALQSREDIGNKVQGIFFSAGHIIISTMNQLE